MNTNQNTPKRDANGNMPCPHGHTDPIYVDDDTAECAVCGERYNVDTGAAELTEEVAPAPAYSTARMTPAATRMAGRIPTDLRIGVLVHDYTSMGDTGPGVFGFSDTDNDYRVYSDGVVEATGPNIGERVRVHAAIEAGS